MRHATQQHSVTTGISTGPLRVVVVDDHEIIAAGLRLLARQHDWFEMVATAVDGQSLLLGIDHWDPDLLVIDVQLQGRSGLDLLVDVRRTRPHQQIVFYSATMRDDVVGRGIELGADGFLSKQGSPEQMLESLRQFHTGVVRRPLVDAVTGSMVGAYYARTLRGDEPPTPRQLAYVEAVARGLTNGQIAREIGVTPATVKTILARLRTKAGAKDRANLVSIAIHAGWIEPTGRD
jgi:DNA-binding NarL/FixJ family response regulator